MPGRADRQAAIWPSGRGRRVLIILAFVCLAVSVLGLVMRSVPPRSQLTIFLASASPYLLGAALLAMLLAAVAGAWLVLLLAIVVAGFGAATQARLFVATAPPPKAVDVTVMTSNLRLGSADPHALVTAVREHHVDVLMLEELTPGEQRALVAAGLDRALPHHASEPDAGGAGTGLWSRFAIQQPHYPDQFTFRMVVARVAIPGLTASPTFVALHTAGPIPDPTPWVRDMNHLPALLSGLPHDAPVVVGGDFNATNDDVPFRKLLSHTYRDAADQAGAGYTRTYPSNRWFPPLLAIDHVLTRKAVATGVRTLEIPGSDHRALLVEVALPKS